jgi:hypothetical protein
VEPTPSHQGGVLGHVDQLDERLEPGRQCRHHPVPSPSARLPCRAAQ